jgi:cytochrome bd-type quinol oxidase subunit 2
MEMLWFVLVGFLLTGYVVLDGFDLGAGIIHFRAAKTDDERRLILKAIGPVWDGNEVWLLAAGGTLYFAFPMLYASSFSGFYLPLMIVLWLIMLRAIGIELRSHGKAKRRDSSILPSQFRASCWRSSSEPRLATLYAEFRSTRRATSSNRCGRRSQSAQIRGSSIGTLC